MQKFTYEVTIEAKTGGEAESKLRSAAILMKKLSEKELKVLADTVQNNPVKTALAKQYLGL